MCRAHTIPILTKTTELTVKTIWVSWFQVSRHYFLSVKTLPLWMNAVWETRFCFLKTSRELKNVSSKNYVRSLFRTWILFPSFVKSRWRFKVVLPAPRTPLFLINKWVSHHPSPPQPCVPISASPVTKRAPAVPIVTRLNLQLYMCCSQLYPNWSPLTAMSLALCQDASTKTATEQQRWSGCKHNTCADAPVEE